MLGLFTKKKKGEHVTFSIVGMHCTSCVINIDGELEETEGVLSSSTSYAKATTTVTFDPSKITKEKLREAIKKAGYEVTAKG